MKVSYENIESSLIPNTTMRKMLIDGVHKTYNIYPMANCVLHDNTLDHDVYDENGIEVIGRKFGYSPSSVYVTCGASYDFTPHTVTDENGNIYIAYGNRDFFVTAEQFKEEESNV